MTSTTFSTFYSNLKSTQGSQVRKLLEQFVKDFIRTSQFQILSRQEQSQMLLELMEKM